MIAITLWKVMNIISVAPGKKAGNSFVPVFIWNNKLWKGWATSTEELIVQLASTLLIWVADIYLCKILTGKDCMLLSFIVLLFPPTDSQCRPFEQNGPECMEKMRTLLYTCQFLGNLGKFCSLEIKLHFIYSDKQKHA